VENNQIPFTRKIEKGEVLNIPIAHGEGRYYVPDDLLKQMEDRNQIVLRYCEKDGSITPSSNPNGSIDNIAGVCNKEGNVFGLMPHPERASEDLLGSHDGLLFWHSLIS
jgi:phosphoribosylformylglycinamidine synthase